MNKKLIEFGNKKYFLDINNIIQWILNPSSPTNSLKETEINEGYDTNDNGDLTMMTKVVRELKTNNSQNDTIRYDFIKLLLTPFLDVNKDISTIKGSFKNTLIFNTLIEMGFLKEITD
jgi:hypothetical protein